ncbi:MAG: GIY-YIG nuclease family protein [Planctomycetia bacterium]|nr:GIY-YIG nuclease family protein [Planctomycetia bacterium]
MDTALFNHDMSDLLGPNRYDLVTDDTPAGGSIIGDGASVLSKRVRAQVPQYPGIYAMFDQQGKVIYVGKAKRLRTRLLNYFRKKSQEKRKAQRLLRRTQTIAWEYAPHEFAALLRELDLIQQHKPRFNVMGQPLLKRRTYLCLGRSPAPYLYAARHPPADGTFFGPIRHRPEILDVLRLLNDHFKLRDCPRKQVMQFAEQRSMIQEDNVAGCIRHELGTCLGPCARLCTSRQYQARVKEAKNYFHSLDTALSELIREKMQQAARELDFELAGKLRDQLASLEWLMASLQRVQETRRELSFIYPVEVNHRQGQVLWYLIHEGQWRCTLFMPQDYATRQQAWKTIDGVFAGKTPWNFASQSIDHLWLTAAWFRKFPQERARCISVEDARRICSQKSAS